MNRSDILFVGIGQAGNNLVSDLLTSNRRYNGLFVNTSYEDLKDIQNAKNTFIVPAAGGTARNRNKAKTYIKEHILSLADEIKKFPQQKVIYVVFSLGGGTGSGISPALINVMKKIFPNLLINVVGILPNESESIKAQSNSLECWNELRQCSNLGCVYILDNNRRKDKLEVNAKFVELFNSFLDCTESNKKGVLDKEEVEILAKTSGVSAIYEYDNKKKISDIMKKSIFVTNGTFVCEYLGLSVNDGTDTQDVLDIFKPKMDNFEGFTDKEEILIISGMKIRNSMLDEVKETYERKDLLLAVDGEDEEDSIIEIKARKISAAPINKKVEEAVNLDDLDDEDLWDSMLNM